MAIEVKHPFTNPKADGPDNTIVRPSNWNAEHVVNMATGFILGRTTAGAGAVEELSAATVRTFLDIEFVVNVLADLATTTVPAGVDQIIIERYAAGSLVTNARYRKVAANPVHALAGQDASAQWWEISEIVITPAMAGAVYDYTAASPGTATNDLAAFNRAYNVLRQKIVAGKIPPKLAYGHYGTGFALIEGSINATNLRGSGVTEPKLVFNPLKIEGWGTVLIGRGAGNAVLDMTLDRTVQHEGVSIKGEAANPPDIGFLNSRDSALAASNRNSLHRCAAIGWYRFAARVVFACEIQRDSYCTWWNENDGSDLTKIIAGDGKVFAEYSSGANHYPTIIKSQYQTTTFALGDASGFGGQTRTYCDWLVPASVDAVNAHPYPLCFSRSEGFTIDPGYIQAVSGHGALLYIGTNGVYHPKGMYLNLHVEGLTDSWLKIESAPGETTPINLELLDVEIHEHATQGTHPNGIFDIADSNLSTLKWQGGIISIGRFSSGSPAAMFSNPAKVTFNGHATIPLRASFPHATLAAFGGSIFAVDDGKLATPYPKSAITTINNDASLAITYGTDGPAILDISTLTANRNRTILDSGTQLPGDSFRITRTGGGAFPLRVRNFDNTVLIKDLSTNQWCELTWDGTEWKLMQFGAL